MHVVARGPFKLLQSLRTHPLFIPSYFALASVVVLILLAALGSFKRLRPRVSATVNEGHEDEGVASSAQTGLVSTRTVRDQVDRPLAIPFQALAPRACARACAVLVLPCLSIFGFLRD